MPLIDLHSLPTGQEFQSDLLIVGGGIAGLVLADSLRGSDRQVDVLEAGGEALELESQELYAAEMAGLPHLGTKEGRFRVYGGSSTRWGGQLLPLAEHDFDNRSHVSHSGWPVDSSELLPYLSQCEQLMGVNSFPYDSSLIAKLPQPVPKITEAGLRLRFSKWAPFNCRNVARTLGKRCKKDVSTRIFLHASVTVIDLHADGHYAEGVQVRTLSGARFRFKAREIVVAAGTIETNRLLLASNKVHSQGIGNHRDQLGRYFHDHLSVKAASLQPSCLPEFLQRTAPSFLNATRHTIKFETTADWQASQRCLNVMGHLVFEAPQNSGFAWVRQQLQARQSGFADNPGIQVPGLQKLPGEFLDIGYLAWKRLVRKRRWCPANGSINLFIDTEQQPNPDSRICLSSNRDALDMPKAVMQWDWGEPESQSFLAYSQLFQRQWEAWDCGSISWFEPFGNKNISRPLAADIYHPMGGTRMASDPSRGVVDKCLKVHGIHNLFVASCSVFPTGGSSNPTLTLIQLSLRLADHLSASASPA